MKNKIPSWRFLVPLLFQAGLILFAPAQAIYTQITGKTIVLQTIPFDPSDFFQKNVPTLRYEISTQETLRKLPGWQTILTSADVNTFASLKAGTRFYVILQAPKLDKQAGKLPRVWKPIAISRDRPSNLPPNRVALQGVKSSSLWIDYGIEQYYLVQNSNAKTPLSHSVHRRLTAVSAQEPNFTNQNLIAHNVGRRRALAVEIKVDSRGSAVPTKLWIGENNYPL
jgi:uncharacterized membrane-anchored protein